jgi:hypothetical protein
MIKDAVMQLFYDANTQKIYQIRVPIQALDEIISANPSIIAAERIQICEMKSVIMHLLGNELRIVRYALRDPAEPILYYIGAVLPGPSLPKSQ